MRTHFIVLLLKGSKEYLLCEIVACRAGRFVFQDTVYAFVLTVLLWLAGLVETGLDAELQPPDGESGKVPDGLISERHTIVRAN